jgi:hypothetical protein
MNIQDDQKKLLDDELKAYKEKMNKEAELKGEEIFWGDDPKIFNKPDRAVFTIDVGNLPKGKAEDYIKKIVKEYREKFSKAQP